MATIKKTETKAVIDEVTAEPVFKPEAAAKTVKTKAVKTAAAKPPASKAAKKTASAKTAIKTKVYVQYHGKEVSVDMLTEEAKKAYTATGHKASEIKTVSLYVKPEEDVAYFVVNGEGSEECRIYL